MTKITEQLEAFSHDEITFMHGLFSNAVERIQGEIEHTKRVSGFLNAMKDLTEVYFADGEIAKVITTNGEDISETDPKADAVATLEKLEATHLQYLAILNKLQPLIEIIGEDSSN